MLTVLDIDIEEIKRKLGLSPSSPEPSPAVRFRPKAFRAMQCPWTKRVFRKPGREVIVCTCGAWVARSAYRAMGGCRTAGCRNHFLIRRGGQP